MTAIARPMPVAVRGASLLVPLLALAVFINYVDRGAIATAGPLMKDELHLNGKAFGVLVSAFFWTYTPAQFLAGALAERWGAYLVMALGLATWALATAVTGVASTFAVLLGLRLVLGLGESAFFPCSSKLLAGALPESKLGAANGLVGVGLALGPAFGTFVGGLIMVALGWRPVFILFGLVSLLWLWPWLASTRNSRAAARSAPESGEAPTYAAVIRQRGAWGAGLGHLCNNYGFYFVVFWLPLYLVKERGFSLSAMAQAGGLVYVAFAVATLSAGWLSDRWIAAGGRPSVVRKAFAIGSSVGAAACLALCAAAGPTLAVAALMGAAFFFGLGMPMLYTIGQTLAGPRAAGKWMGFQNGVGNLSGIVGPLVTGALVDASGGRYDGALAVAAGVSLMGAVAWGVIVPKVEPIDWMRALRPT